MRLLDLASYKGAESPIVLPHEEWIIRDGIYTQKALDFMLGEMNKPQRDRTGHLSASSLGSCGRQQQFTWIGLPQKVESAQREAVFNNGDFVHLRLQMAGLSAGWLSDAETAIPENEYGVKGTMDGLHRDGSVVEFKSQNSFGFSRLLSAKAPKSEHVFQVGAYLLATGRKRAYLVYENKDNQELKEFTVERTDELMEKVRDRLEYVQGWSGRKELIEPLGDCLERKGMYYNYCSFRDVCLETHTWRQAEKQALEARSA